MLGVVHKEGLFTTIDNVAIIELHLVIYISYTVVTRLLSDV